MCVYVPEHSDDDDNDDDDIDDVIAIGGMLRTKCEEGLLYNRQRRRQRQRENASDRSALARRRRFVADKRVSPRVCVCVPAMFASCGTCSWLCARERAYVRGAYSTYMYVKRACVYVSIC